jgi:flagellar basal body-associated protein FliL
MNVREKQGLSQTDKKIVGTLLIALLAIVSTVSIGYILFSQSNQPVSTATNSLSPMSTPSPSPSEESTEPASIHEPSVPQFTVELVDHSYDVPPSTTTTIDQYTGKEIVTNHPGYRVTNKSIEVAIKNTRLTPYADVDGQEAKLYYDVRVKGYFGEDWTAPLPFQGSEPISRIPVNSGSGYTVVTCAENYPADSQLDFQVEAYVGHYYYESLPGHPLAIFYTFKVDATSGWSNTQTINIP